VKRDHHAQEDRQHEDPNPDDRLQAHWAASVAKEAAQPIGAALNQEERSNQTRRLVQELSSQLCPINRLGELVAAPRAFGMGHLRPLSAHSE
jgi:hypothetical protein